MSACASPAPRAPIANSVPGWSARCARIVEESVRVDAGGVDRLVVPVDDTLRACWRAAFEVVNQRRTNVIAPSCRALKLAEPPPSEKWLASCRRYEVVGLQPRFAAIAEVRIKPAPPPALGFGGRRQLTLLAPREPLLPVELVARRLGDTPAPPPVPPYDLTPAAKQVCAAITDLTTMFTARPSPQLPLVVDARWDGDAFALTWPNDSEITPIEDALAGCLAGWTVVVTTGARRIVTWENATFAVKLVTSPERKLAIRKR
jgi:hypothetical protein